MNELTYNLHHGTMAVAVPELFRVFGEKTFTTNDIINLNNKYCSLKEVKKMHRIGYIENTNRDKQLHVAQWRFRREAIPHIRETLSYEKSGN